MPEPLLERPLHGPPTLFESPIHIQIQMAQDPCDLYDRITCNALAANQKGIPGFEVQLLALAKPQLLPNVLGNRDPASL